MAMAAYSSVRLKQNGRNEMQKRREKTIIGKETKRRRDWAFHRRTGAGVVKSKARE